MFVSNLYPIFTILAKYALTIAQTIYYSGINPLFYIDDIRLSLYLIGCQEVVNIIL